MDPSGIVASSQSIEELQNSGGGTDISSHITASTTSYYLEITTKTLLTTG
jgi:hypothetical protein